MAQAPGILARGPWDPAAIEVTWREDEFEPSPTVTEAADVALDALRRRGSPSHDGLAARLVEFDAGADVLELVLQPARWALRLVPDQGSRSLSIVCLVRGDGGSWLAGRRAGWVASWAGRWMLGAGGSVEAGENPVHTMRRELLEEWSVEPQRLVIEALVLAPTGLVLLVGQAWLPKGATVVPDHEHDEFAWWPADVEQWPAEAHEPLRRMGTLLSDGR